MSESVRIFVGVARTATSWLLLLIIASWSSLVHVWFKWFMCCV